MPDQTFKTLNLSEADTQVCGLSTESGAVKKGGLFIALQGEKTHGAEYIADVLPHQPSAILTDKKGAEIIKNNKNNKTPIFIRPNPRHDLSLICAQFYPAQPSKIVAITGTNAKTSISHFTRQIWQHLNHQSANIGTMGVQGDYDAPLHHTTPDPITLHRLLDDMTGQGITHAAMEASSHGLSQHRLDGVRICAAAFSNFSQDHLDYHKNFADYFNAKARLFRDILPPDGVAVININNEKGRDIYEIAKSRGQEIMTFGTGGDMQIHDLRADDAGQDLRFSWQGTIHQTRLNLIGAFQADNALMAAMLAIACGAESDAVFATFPHLKTVEGRMELVVRRANGAPIFVDYAHTPDALRHALQSLRAHIMGRVIVVFGAGGDRDKTKREMMGQVAAQGADEVIVTDDNPRGEAAKNIRAMVMQGCPKAQEFGDRAEAILHGIAALEAGDALLIAGKGHESGQTIGGTTFAFVDGEQASISVAALDGGAA